MRKFMKTTVPTDGYGQVKKVGDRWIVHLEPMVDGNATVCYECVVDAEPDIAVLTGELAEWKAYIAGKELEIKKMVKIKELEEYDKSVAVNSFAIKMNGEKLTDYWLDRDLRSSLKDDVETAAEYGDTYNFDVRELGITLPLNCNKFLAALKELRVYAYTAFNVTSRHRAAINALTTVADVEAYDFTQGYPLKKEFNVEDLSDD